MSPLILDQYTHQSPLKKTPWQHINRTWLGVLGLLMVSALGRHYSSAWVKLSTTKQYRIGNQYWR